MYIYNTSGVLAGGAGRRAEQAGARRSRPPRCCRGPSLFLFNYSYFTHIATLHTEQLCTHIYIQAVRDSERSRQERDAHVLLAAAEVLVSFCSIIHR